MSAFPHLALYNDHLETVKDDLLKMWMSQTGVDSTLKTYNITPEFFSRYFGRRIIDHAFNTLRGVHTPGNCPMISVMLIYFQKKDFALEDIFEICSSLKNSMYKCAFNHEILTRDTIHEIALLMDQNLKGMIREYVEIKFNAQPQHLICPINPPSRQKTMSGDIQSSEKTTLSALRYLQEIEVDFDLLDELNEIEAETFSSMDILEAMTQSAYNEVIALFNDYTKVLSQLVDFNEITYALKMLIDLLKNTTPASIGEDQIGVITIYIKAIISDLSIWRKSVFVDQSADDIHYLDETLMSSITQLHIMLSEQDNIFTHEIEFF